ncbi:MAG: glycosyltransferase family 2 protein [Alicyclobacillus sp.]|nr:glycosyltransferase family 2 protein [Alicyclobacillus sp.]
MKTLIAIPAYNEAHNIGRVLKALSDAKLGADILVVNDGSMDQTETIALAYSVEVISHPCNMGYGAALQTAYKYATLHGYDRVVQFDSDGQHRVEDIATLLSTAQNCGEPDIVLGSRFLGDARFYPGPGKMSVIRMFRQIIRLLTRRRITDPTSGLRLVGRRVFTHYAAYNRFPNDFPDADVIIDVLLRKWDIVEVPVSNTRRVHGRSMHAGLRPIVYVCKVLLSIFVVVMNVRLERNR